MTGVKRTSRRSLYELAFACDTLIRFVGALNAIFKLAADRKLFDNFKTPPGTNRLISGLMATISPTLNLWDSIGYSPFLAHTARRSL
jgi:hypothetical protein